jgi:hypothetical protein
MLPFLYLSKFHFILSPAPREMRENACSTFQIETAGLLPVQGMFLDLIKLHHVFHLTW